MATESWYKKPACRCHECFIEATLKQSPRLFAEHRKAARPAATSSIRAIFRPRRSRRSRCGPSRAQPSPAGRKLEVCCRCIKCRRRLSHSHSRPRAGPAPRERTRERERGRDARAVSGRGPRPRGLVFREKMRRVVPSSAGGGWGAVSGMRGGGGVAPAREGPAPPRPRGAGAATPCAPWRGGRGGGGARR